MTDNNENKVLNVPDYGLYFSNYKNQLLRNHDS